MGEPRRSPTTMILWVLTGCVAFVVVGYWITQPRSDAKEWQEEWDDEEDYEEVRTHDTFEDAWKQVWKTGKSARPPDDVTKVARTKKPETRTAKSSQGRSKEQRRPERQPEQVAERTAPESPEDSPPSKGSPAKSGPSEETPVRIDDSEGGLAVVEPAPASHGESDPAEVAAVVESATAASNGTSTDLTGTRIVTPVAKVSPRAKRDVDDELAALTQPMEPRVVTLRLSGSLGGQRLDPKDGYAWGRLSYHFQRERKPPYFLVYPGGAISGVMGPPPAAGRLPGETKTVQGLPSMRPRGKLGPPLFVINLLATVESAGTMRFYGQGVAQKYLCRLNAQVIYTGDETPKVVDSFTVTESATAVQGRGAVAGPPGAAIYQAAVEKLIARLRATTYFR